MSTDETQAMPVAARDACRSCGSGDRAEAHYVASPLTGIPVTCTDDWRDEDAAEPGAPRAATEDDHEPTLANIPAVAGWDLTRQLPSPGPAPEPEPARPPAIHCPDCGETFAEAGFGGKALFLADALHAAALAAGWAEAEGRWTCSVCLAGIAGPLYGPEREPAPSMPAPETDPIDQSLAVLAEADSRRPGWWDETNRRNSATAHKNSLRFGDGRHGLEVVFGRTPDLREDPETAVALLNYEAELAERAQAMHRESLERREAEHRAFLERLAMLREPEGAAA